ncbi:hypothetical protein ABBQ38_015169 [Trebouxia sp. C0009 RCD-2024]
MEVQHAPRSPPPVRSSWKEHIVQNYLPLVFAVAIILAMSWPTPGLRISSLIVKEVHVIQALNTFLVFLVSGLTLNISDLRAALKAWLGLLYGVPAILLITPCLGFAATHLHLQPPEFRTGLAIFCAVPTTLGVGVSLTAAAKGNQALALFLTVFTNLLGIVTVPFGLKLILVGTDTLSVNPARLVASLLLTVLVPTILAATAANSHESSKQHVSTRRRHLGSLAYIGPVHCPQQSRGQAQPSLSLVPECPTKALCGVFVLQCGVRRDFGAQSCSACQSLPWAFDCLFFCKPGKMNTCCFTYATFKSSPLSTLSILPLGVLHIGRHFLQNRYARVWNHWGALFSLEEIRSFWTPSRNLCTPRRSCGELYSWWTEHNHPLRQEALIGGYRGKALVVAATDDAPREARVLHKYP